MSQYLYIASGGALGAVLRYIVSNGVDHWLGRGFPYGTLIVNISGSLMVGLLYVLLIERIDVNIAWHAGLIVGMFGAFTTFSTFSVETLNLIESDEQLKACLNVSLSVVLCIFGCWLGTLLGRFLVNTQSTFQ